MSLLSEIKKHFKTQDLYQVFQIPEKDKNTLSESKLKKLYYKLALQYHPDKNTNLPKKELEISTKKFQLLGKIHKILSTKELKELYDETGEIEEDDITSSESFEGGSSGEGEAWNNYWRTLYPKVTITELKEFEKEYRAVLDRFAIAKSWIMMS